MADLPIYKVTSTPPVRWGERIYYYNCHRQGGKDFAWHGNNISAYKAATINADWVFAGKWKL
jgi:pectinesterase